MPFQLRIKQLMRWLEATVLEIRRRWMRASTVKRMRLWLRLLQHFSLNDEANDKDRCYGLKLINAAAG